MARMLTRLKPLRPCGKFAINMPRMTFQPRPCRMAPRPHDT